MGLFDQALQAQRSGRRAEAEALYRKIIASEPKHFDALHMLGVICSESHRYEEADKFFGAAVAIDPNFPPCCFNFGSHFARQKKYQAAVEQFDKTLALSPGFAPAHSDRGCALGELGQFDEALASLNKAMAIASNIPVFWFNRANIFFKKQMHESAIRDYDQAIKINANYAEAWAGRGNALRESTRYDEAFAAYDRSLSINPQHASAWYGRASVFSNLHRDQEAADAYAEVLKLDANFPYAKGRLLHHKMICCDWKDIDKLTAEIDQDIISGKPSVEPFGWQGVCNSPRSLQLCAELYSEENYRTNIKTSVRQALNPHQKIRIGYSSGELRDQATSHLIVGVFELHDRSKFEIYAIDNGWDDQSETRKRINASVHSVIDISQLNDASAVAAIRENQIDILVNLNGYFGRHRMQVFAQRPAPIQVNYLGFPGTLGAPYMDYIIADRHVIPPNHTVYYSEKIVYLPDSYQANDRRKEIRSRIFSRTECNLPEKGIVFCCFNNNYKIVPALFDCWMRILSRVEDSVLWLIEGNTSAIANLRKEARARGVDPYRLIFAKRIPLPEHLARHRLADVFLDTLPCNAHTTASDALWAELPLLTQIGETFSGRVAASLLNAVGLPELITATPQAYEDLAVELATNPEKLAAIKAKLANNRLTTPLFDTQRFTKHIEAAYTAMYGRYQAHLPPDDVHVLREVIAP